MPAGTVGPNGGGGAAARGVESAAMSLVAATQAGGPATARSPVRPTMAEVGRKAGVSSTAVSLVINDRAAGVISEQTRRRVLAAVAELGYRPNRAAQGLRTRRTQTLGFITDDIAVLPAGWRTVSGAHDVAWRHGSLLFTVHTTRNPHVLRAAVDELLDRQVDAIVFAVAGTRRATLPETVLSVPTVLVNCVPRKGGLPSILPDDAAGGRAATELLLAAGHRRITYVAGLRSAWATTQRLKGHRQALAAAGVELDQRKVLWGNFAADSGYDRTKALLSRPDRPTGIVCGNDRMAMGAYLALREAGVDVPGEMSVVGYDDQEDIAPEIRPALSTVRLPYAEMGRCAATHVFAGTVDALPARTYVSCPVVVRDSVAAPPGAARRLRLALAYRRAGDAG